MKLIFWNVDEIGAIIKKDLARILIALIAIICGLFIVMSGKAGTSQAPIVLLPPKAVSSQEITHGDISKKQMIFTFDAGGGDQSAEKILSILKKHNIRSTFFMTGEFVESHKEFVKRVLADGHEIFNHTYDHPYLTNVSDAGIASELEKMDAVLESATATSSKPYFRPPYGDRDARVAKIAAMNGYQPVIWTLDALDWEEPTGMTADRVTERILSRVSPGTIVLMHIGDDITGNILDDVLTRIEGSGYSVVSLTAGI